MSGSAVRGYKLFALTQALTSVRSLMDVFKFRSVHPEEDENVLHYTPHTFLNSRPHWTWVVCVYCGILIHRVACVPTCGDFHGLEWRFFWDEDVERTLRRMRDLRGDQLERWKLDAGNTIQSRAHVRRCFGRYFRQD